MNDEDKKRVDVLEHLMSGRNGRIIVEVRGDSWMGETRIAVSSGDVRSALDSIIYGMSAEHGEEKK